MSEEHHPNKSAKGEHGTTRSYIVGFILSLVFTFIPYYLVVNKTITGNALVVTIVGIAVLQMAIQMLFFLHLGRGPKPLYNVVFFFGTAGIIVLTVGASLFIMSNLYHNMLPKDVTVRLAQEENISQVGGEETGACTEAKENHLVTIKNDIVSPSRIEAHLCDTLTLINEDEIYREIVFGTHPDHGKYGGLEGIETSKRRPETITLNQAGSFMFHDHLNESVAGYFTVESAEHDHDHEQENVQEHTHEP